MLCTFHLKEINDLWMASLNLALIFNCSANSSHLDTDESISLIIRSAFFMFINFATVNKSRFVIFVLLPFMLSAC